MPMRRQWNVLSVTAISFLLLISSCKTTREIPKPDFSKLTEDFVYGSLALSPAAATQAGYHEHEGVKLDAKLDAFSPEGLEAARKVYADFKEWLAAMDPQSLAPEERAEYQINQSAIALSLRDLQTV